LIYKGNGKLSHHGLVLRGAEDVVNISSILSSTESAEIGTVLDTERLKGNPALLINIKLHINVISILLQSIILDVNILKMREIYQHLETRHLVWVTV
jgi:hypothetical protein